MKRIVGRLAGFLAGVLVLSALAQHLVFGILRKIDVGDFGVMNRIQNGAINSEMLICGSSIGQSHYNPAVLTETTGYSCFNIGLSGSDLGVQLPALKWYLDRNAPPRYVIQDIDLFIGETAPRIYEIYKFLPYLRNESLYRGLSLVDPRLWLNRSFPPANLVYFNRDLQRMMVREYFLNSRSKPDRLIQGYFPNDRPPMSDDAEREFVRKNASGLRYRITDAYKALFEELCGLCRRRGIRLFFVLSPERRSLMALEMNRRELLAFYEDLSERWGAWLIDLSDSELSGEKGLWVNMTHLRAEGAERLTRELARRILEKIPAKSLSDQTVE